MPVIRLRSSSFLPLFACLAAAVSAPSTAAAPTAVEALALKPRQKGVDITQPNAAEAAQATIKQEKEGGVSALVVRGPSREVLRAFADTDGNRVVDRWSYYRDGIEVYREIDSDGDKKADQYRWLGTAGGRWGVDANGDEIIDTWKVLSAEEAAAEVVAALRDRDAAAFARLLPTKDDLQAAGLAGDRLAEVGGRVAAAPAAFAKAAAAQKELGADAKWSSMLVPQPPGTMPAGQDGAAKDVVAYDNVVALVEGSGGSGQVFVGSLLRCGDCWRPVDAPQVAGGGGEVGESYAFFTPRMAAGGGGQVPGDVSEAMKPLLAKLLDIEGKMAAADVDARKALAAEYVGVLEQAVAAAADADKKFWTTQLVEILGAYVQEGLFPDGIARLEQLAEAVKGDEAMAAFVALRLVQARYAAGMGQPGADSDKLQKQWLDDLQAFANAYPKAPEAAEAILQLAIQDEFGGREKEAMERHQAIMATFPDTPQARKAAGSLRRLESVGKPFALAAPSVDGKQVSVEAFKGVPVLVHYWSTDCEPCKVDLATIRELQAKYGPKKLAVVGVALDSDKGKLAKFLQAKPLPWPQLYEPGGLDSRLAEEFGVIALPTMVLIGADGSVLDRNVSITDLERKLDELVAVDGK
ncbi:MAG: redoxin domain-containing protein [Pirellulales bacterium]